MTPNTSEKPAAASASTPPCSNPSITACSIA
jgi:hypothetical protein